MTLLASNTRFGNEVNLLSQHFRRFAVEKSPLNVSANFTFIDECLLEGLLSRLWQAWCVFCRDCVIKSCLGTTTGSGNPVAGLSTALSESHVSAAAIRAKQRKATVWTGTTNGTLRTEPTWGDVGVLVQILGSLRPANASHLLAAFSSGHSSATTLQTIRNAAAHNHAQNLNEVMSLRPFYTVFPIGHPIHALFWVEPSSSDFLVTHAIQELEYTASVAIA
jgi:hypothetical protein